MSLITRFFSKMKLSSPVLTPEQIWEQKLQKRKEVILQIYKMITKSKVQGTLSLEGDVYDFDTETNNVQKYIKKGVLLIIYWIQESDLLRVLEFERFRVLNSKKISNEEIELLYLVEACLKWFYHENIWDMFWQAKGANTFYAYEAFPRGQITEIIDELQKEQIVLRKKKWDYPIKTNEKYEYIHQYVNEKMSFLLNISDESIITFLKNSSMTDLTYILWVCSNEIKDKIFSYCTQRLADSLQYEVDMKFYSIEKIDYYQDQWEKEVVWVTIEDIEKSIKNIYEILPTLSL